MYGTIPGLRSSSYSFNYRLSRPIALIHINVYINGRSADAFDGPSEKKIRRRVEIACLKVRESPSYELG